MLEIYSIILLVVGFYFFFSSVVNGHKIYSDTITEPLEKDKEPFVSVLIPARNEEANIANCLDSFMNQTYSNYEVLVLDDNSTDATSKIVQSYVDKSNGKVRLIHGKELPEGWRGKSFAMMQLTEQAKGEYFLFTDADTIHTEKSVALMMTNMIGHNLDMVSGYLRQTLKTFGEKITVPIMYLMTSIAVPLWLNDKINCSLLSTAIGQFIGIKASSFKAIGGYERIKNITTEDVYLARTMKKAGYKTMFIDFKNAASCRMYSSFEEGVNGISKNVFDFMGKIDIIMILALIAVIGVMFLPFPLLIGKLVNVIFYGAVIDKFFVSLVAINVLYFLSWAIICVTREIPFYITFLYPLIYSVLFIICVVSWRRGKNGKGYVWKGRVVS